MAYFINEGFILIGEENMKSYIFIDDKKVNLTPSPCPHLPYKNFRN